MKTHDCSNIGKSSKRTKLAREVARFIIQREQCSGPRLYFGYSSMNWGNSKLLDKCFNCNPNRSQVKFASPLC